MRVLLPACAEQPGDRAPLAAAGAWEGNLPDGLRGRHPGGDVGRGRPSSGVRLGHGAGCPPIQAGDMLAGATADQGGP